MLENIEKAGEVASTFLKNLEQQKVEKEVSALTEEQKKEKEEAAKKAEAERAESDKKLEEVLDKEEDELSDEEKKLREEALKKIESEPADKKIQRGLKDANKRIDKLTRRSYEQQEEFRRKMEEKENELAELRKSLEKAQKPKPEEVEDELTKAEVERAKKYIVEDAGKERHLRREMTDEELEEWLVEEPVRAHEWMIDRKERRKFEHEQDLRGRGKKEFESESQKSIERLTKAYPNTMPIARFNELKREGKSKDDINKILSSEFVEYRLANEIAIEHEDWAREVDFGDRIAAEIKRRLSAEPKKVKKVYTEEEVQKLKEEAMEQERARLSRVDVGVGSNRGTVTGSFTPEEEALRNIAIKGGLDPDKVLARHKFRQANKGNMEAPMRK